MDDFLIRNEKGETLSFPIIGDDIRTIGITDEYGDEAEMWVSNAELRKLRDHLVSLNLGEDQ